MDYITKAGDTFDSIAFSLFKDIKYTKELMEANEAHIGTIIFDGGIALTVPEVVKDVDNTALPPWRR